MAPFDRTPTIYQITVTGRLAPEWADYLSGVTITINESGSQTTTTLSGEFMDQAALMGVLNNLYNLSFIILSVERQFVINEEKDHV